MTDISALLKEAKPLYQAKKRQRKRIQACLLILFCLGGFSFFNHPATIDLNDDEFYLTDTGGVIEEMGLPTDDYGLLKVS